MNYLLTTQPAPSIPEIFAVCFLSVVMFRTSREHLGNILKQNLFLKVLDGKVVFVLKVYDLIITNVDLLANSRNHEVMFPEYSRNIPRMSVSKIFQGNPWNWFAGYPVNYIGSLLPCSVFLNFIETVLNLE